jgi:hypothetical protein
MPERIQTYRMKPVSEKTILKKGRWLLSLVLSSIVLALFFNESLYIVAGFDKKY